MKRLLLGLLLLTTILVTQTGCKKLIQNAKENALMKIITQNQWVVYTYKEGTTDLTADFSPYEFKFLENGLVYGQRSGYPDAQGTWSPNTTDITITSAFPFGPAPLHKLTGTWKITKTTETTVQSNRIENGVTYYLNLRAK